jgi:WD40 repeat protein
MTNKQTSCPECGEILSIPSTLERGKTLRCPQCDARFAYRGSPTGVKSKPISPPRKAAQADDYVEAEEVVTRSSAGPRARRQPLQKPRGGLSPLAWGRILAGVLVLLVGGALLVAMLLSGGKEKEATPHAERPPRQPIGPPLQQQQPNPNPQDNQPPPEDKGPVKKGPPQDVVVPGDVPIEAMRRKDRPLLVVNPGGHSAMVRRVLFTPDGRQLITVSNDKTIRVTEVATGDTVGVLRLPIGLGDEGALLAADLSPDGKRLAVGGQPFGRGAHGVLIHLIRVDSGQVEKVFTGHTQGISGLAFSRDGKWLASASADCTARVYELTTGKSHVFTGHTERLKSIAVSPDSKYLATVGAENSARLWSLETGKAVAELPPSAEPYFSVAWSPDSTALATGRRDGLLQLWSPAGTLKKDFTVVPGEKIELYNLAFSPDGQEVLYSGVIDTGRAGLFNLATGKARIIFKGHNNTVTHGSFSPDGKLVATAGGDDHETLVWRVADGKVVQKIVGRGKSIWSVGWSKDSKTIAWGNTNRGDNSPLERAFRMDELAFGPGPKEGFLRLPSSIGGYSLERIDFFKIAIKHNGKPLHVFESPYKGDRLYSFSLLTNGRAVMGGSFGMYLVDMRTNKIVRTYVGHSGLVLTVAPSPDGRYFLSGSTDQTLCLWNQDQDEPLLSLFVAGRDWIAWTPQGYYAASPYGERLMGWQVNNGPNRMASYYEAGQFRSSLYQPDVIRLTFQTGNVGQAVALASKKKQVATVNVAQVLPPAVVITAPAAGEPIQINKTRLEVKARASSTGKHPVTAMRLLVDGRPYKGEKGRRVFEKPQLGEVEAAWEVDLMPGKHGLAVLAESEVSKGITPWSVVTVEGVDAADLPNLYVVAVGISAYPGKMALLCAGNDAVAIDKVFRENTGGVFNKVESKLLTDKQATRKNILDGIRWLERKMTARDVGVIFFAGHGGRSLDGEFFLIPVDARPGKMALSCVSGDFLKKSLANMPGRLIAMLDACHSGSVAEDDEGKAVADDLVRDDYGVVVMCSSLGQEYSMESPMVKHGFFTLGLVEGLSGKADFNKDGYIYIHEVDFYASLRVQQLSMGMQNPVTGRPPSIRSFPLTRP